MKERFRIALEFRSELVALMEALSIYSEVMKAGSAATARILGSCREEVLKRLETLSACREDYLKTGSSADYSLLEYALLCGLQAVFPETRGRPPKPLSLDSFYVRIARA